MAKGLRIILIIFLILTSRLVSVAQNEYRTDLLVRMASKLKIAEQLDTLRDSIYYNLFSYRERPLTVIVDNHRVEHIGYHLFTNEHRDVFHTPVINFLERYFLELDLGIDSIHTMKDKMENDNVRFHKGNSKFFRNLPNDSLYQIAYFVSIQNINERGYSVEWLKDSTIVCGISFPIEYAVLTGTDMVEYENRLKNEIERDTLKSPKVAEVTREMLKKEWQENYYILKGDYYYFESLNNHQFFVMDSLEQLRPMYDSIHVVESLHNLFTMPYLENEYTLDVKLVKYGFKKEFFSIPLKQWLRFCLNSGCRPYFGIISNDGKNVVCELIMRNSDMAYVHVMNLTFDLKTLEERGGVIKARLNSYIPTARIKYLFEEIKR